jgi:hypothetical protein
MPERPTLASTVIVWVIVGGSVALGAWIFAARYQECRTRGFSTFYCWTN